LRFFPKIQTPVLNGSTYTTTGTKAKLNFNVLQSPPQITVSTKTVPTTQNTGGNVNRLAYSLATNTNLSSLSTAVAFAWSPATATPRTVSYLADADGTAWKFKAGNQTVILNRNVTANGPDEKARLVTCIEAESVTPAGPFLIYNDEPDASGGQYIAAQAGTVTNSPDTLPAPSVQYSFQVPAAGNYSIWARVKAASGTEHSLYFAVNPIAGTTYTLGQTQTYGSWVWTRLVVSAPLSATANVLALKYRQELFKVDQIIVTDDSSYTPTGKY
jgi:hypothetical protein